MSRIKNFMNNIVYNLKETITRFPMTIVFLSSLSTVMFLIIEDYSSLDIDLLSRYMFAGIFGAFLATTVRFMMERYENLKNSFLFYGLTILLPIGFLYFMTDDKVDNKMLIHFLCIICSISVFAVIKKCFKFWQCGTCAFQISLYGYSLRYSFIRWYCSNNRCYRYIAL